MKAVVGAFNQEKALVIVKSLRISGQPSFEALEQTASLPREAEERMSAVISRRYLNISSYYYNYHPARTSLNHILQLS